MNHNKQNKLPALVSAGWFFVVANISNAIGAEIPWHEGLSSWRVTSCIAGLAVQLSLQIFATLHLLRKRHSTNS